MAPARRTMARQRFQAPRPTWIIPFIAISTTLVFVVAAVLGLTLLKPRSIECITTEHTYCREDIQSTLQTLDSTRFFLPGKALRVKEKELIEMYPDLIAVELNRTLTGSIQATITLAQPLMTVQLNGQNVLIRENGYISPTPPIEGQLAVELTATQSGQQLSAPWGRTEQKNLAELIDALTHFRPRIKKITVQQPTKVTALPEDNGPIYLRVDEESNVAKQLSTLQAFFRSTTMDRPYQELDVRFSNLVIKE